MRQCPFVVSDTQASTLPLPSTVQDRSRRQHLLRLSPFEDVGLGEELAVIWELETGAAGLEKAQHPTLQAFDPPRVFDAFLDAVAWGAVSSADDRALQAPFRSGVDVDDYQLDPVVRILSMPRVSLLIADDVGLEFRIVDSALLADLRRRRGLIVRRGEKIRKVT